MGDRLCNPGGLPSGYGRNELWDRASFHANRPGQAGDMTIGTSIFLIALGAILAFAVNATVAGFSIQTAGVILMVAGVIGLVIGLFLLHSRRARPAERTVYEDRTGRTV
jgi:Flp pilus assembly protein TadB